MWYVCCETSIIYYPFKDGLQNTNSDDYDDVGKKNMIYVLPYIQYCETIILNLTQK